MIDKTENPNEAAILAAAKVCHEANKAYCETIGDHSQSDWEVAPDWQKESAISGVRRIFEGMNSPLEMMDPKRSHEAWLEQKMIEGWRYAPVKDPEKKEHPCFRPWHLLPEAQKRKDYIFIAVAKAMLQRVFTNY